MASTVLASNTKLAVDVMGGDESPHSFVCASIFFLKHTPEVEILLFGDEPALRQSIPSKIAPSVLNRLHFRHADDVVAPSEKPAIALRQKRSASMWLAAEAVAQGEADALLSAGNTGALMAISRHLLGSLDGIDRPAICKRMPVNDRCCYVLDLGANIDATPNQLHQFALMGAALTEVENISPAKVGLLNMGQEHQKGTEALKQTAQLLAADSRFEYCGFVEGNALFEGDVNVVVCDGFTGNAALKAAEGLARYLGSDIRRYFTASIWRKLLGGSVSLLARGWYKRLNPASYNGALLLGLDGVVVKSHGAADQKGFYAALQVCFEQAKRKPHKRLSHWLRQ